jgi:signal transduction histidine kinase
MVYLDDERYSQVLANLLSNAAKFSPPGSTIEINAELRGEWVRVEVRDRGQGIPEDFRARIFSKFSHADSGEARHKGGVGLGLYITRQLVEQMRGNIGFASEVGSGTTFWVEFPCVTRGQRQLRPDRLRFLPSLGGRSGSPE